MKISNTEPILCYFRRLIYLQNKTWFQNRQVHIYTDLKWSSQYQSGLEMTWLAPDWLLTAPVIPWEALRGPSCPNWSLRGCPGHSGASRGISKPLWCCEDHFRPVWICTCLFWNPFLFCKYLSFLKKHKIGSVFKIYMWISAFRRKKGFRNLFIGFGDIKQTNILTFFLKHPVG